MRQRLAWVAGCMAVAAVATAFADPSFEAQANGTIIAKASDLKFQDPVSNAIYASIQEIMSLIATVNSSTSTNAAGLTGLNTSIMDVQTGLDANIANTNALNETLQTVSSTATQASHSLNASVQAALTKIDMVNSTAQYASDTADLNVQQWANLNSQITQQLNFTGPAAPLADLQSAINSFNAMTVSMNNAIARLERSSYTTCASICKNGRCVNVTNATHIMYSCRCTPPYVGVRCDETASPTNAPTASPTAEPTLGRINSCNEAPSSGVYRFPAGFDAYCLVQGSVKWMKILHWDGNMYSMTRSAVSPSRCQSARSSGFCKLSDAQINSVVPRGRMRYYQLDTPEFSQSMWLRTPNQYSDTASGWGCGPPSGNCVGKVQNSFPGQNFRGVLFRYNWIDFLHTRSGCCNMGQGCQRYFLGHGNHDCYAVGNNRRCIRGGGGCGNHRFIRTWDMWMTFF